MRSNVILDPKTQQIYEERPAPPLKILLLEGGGIRGLAYSDLVEVLARLGILEEIEHVSGSSIGAVGALLIALGYTPDEIKRKLDGLPYASFLEGKDPSSYLQFFVAVFIKKTFSLATGKKFREWLEGVVEEKLGRKDATFLDLAKKVETNKEGFKYLHVSGSNVSKNRIEIFNHEKTPGDSIVDATLISASYPSVFQAVVHNDNTYLDGGLMNNLPVFTFNDRRYVPEGYDLNDRGANPAALQVKIDNEEEMGLLWNNYKIKQIKTIYEHCMAVFYGMQSRDGELVELAPTNIVQIFDCNIDTFKINMNDLEKTLLLNSARESFLQWLYNHCNEAFSVKTYKNINEWLASKTFNEVAAIKQYYIHELEKIKEPLSPQTQTYKTDLQAKIRSLSDFNIEYFNLLNEVPIKALHYKKMRARLNADPQKNMAEIEAVDRKLKLLDKDVYTSFANLALFLDYDIQKIPLTKHIDIKVVAPRAKIEKKIKADARERLLFLREKKSILEEHIRNLASVISADIDRIHDGAAFEQIIYLNILKEELKLFDEVERSLNDVLCLPQQPLPAHSEYSELQTNIEKYLNSKTVSWRPHFALIKCINAFLESKTIALKEGREVLSLDLRSNEDYKLFLLAALFYFRFIDSDHAICQLIAQAYEKVFQEKMPTHIEGLKDLFPLNHVDFHLLTYRIELLIKYLASVDRPKEKAKYQMLHLEDIFIKFNDPKLKAETIFAKYQERKSAWGKSEEDMIEMTFLYKPFCYTDKFLLFHSAALKDSISSDHCVNELEEERCENKENKMG